MKANDLTNYKGKPVYYALVLLESLVMKKVLKELGWSKLANRRTNHRLVLFYKILNNLAPQYLKRLCN